MRIGDGALLRQAHAEATRAGDLSLEPEHLLVAVAAGPPGPARAALEALGAGQDALAHAADSWRGREAVDDPAPAAHLIWGPSLNRVYGTARGFSYAWGTPAITPEQWLLALLYSADREVERVLARLEAAEPVTPPAIVAELRRLGVTTPTEDPPVYRPWKNPRRVELDEPEFSAVVDLLRTHYRGADPPRWGFGHLSPERTRGRITVEEGIDVDALLAEARAAR